MLPYKRKYYGWSIYSSECFYRQIGFSYSFESTNHLDLSLKDLLFLNHTIVLEINNTMDFFFVRDLISCSDSKIARKYFHLNCIISFEKRFN